MLIDMPRKISAKQIKYFGTKAQRAGLKRKRVVSVVRRRRSYSPRTRRYARRVSRAFSPSKAMIGGAGYAVLMPMLASKIPMLNQPIIRAAGGYMLAKKSGVLGDIGKAALYIEIANFASGMAGGMGLSGGTDTSAVVS